MLEKKKWEERDNIPRKIYLQKDIDQMINNNSNLFPLHFAR